MRRRWLQITLVLLAAALGYGVVQWLRARALPPSQPTAAVRQGDFLVTVSVRGAIASQRSVEINAPDIKGLTITWLAPRGSVVQQGTPLARFDSSTARQDLDAKTAALHQAQATLDQAQAAAHVSDQQDTLDLATAVNAVDSATLDASKAAILSPIDGDESKLALGMAQEKLRVEQATIAAHQASNQAKIASAQRLRDKAQADLNLVQSQLKQMEIAAPLTGVVNYLTNYSQGYLNAQPFKVGDTVWPRGTLAEIPDLTSLQLLASVSEVDRGRVAPGDPVHLHLDALPELAISGHIASISALAEMDYDSGVWPPPRAFRLVCQLDSIDKRLRPDMNGGVDVITRRIPNALSVPAAAIFVREGKPVVYALAGNHFDPEPVTVIARNPDEVAVTGVAPNARVALEDPTVVAAGKRPDSPNLP